MYRRIVSLFLLPCVLLTQSAALGHCHDVSGHARAPHIHTRAIFGQITSQCGHHHNHDGRDDVPEPDTQPTPQPEPLSDHDSDAVYFTSVDVVINARSAVGIELTASSFWAAIGLIPSTAFLANPPHQVATWTHAPPSSGCVCPLYIRHLALLI